MWLQPIKMGYVNHHTVNVMRNTVHHIVDTWPRTKFEGGIEKLYKEESEVITRIKKFITAFII